MGLNFLIKHCSSGKFFHPQGGEGDPPNETPIILHEDVHPRMHWTFERDHDQWGYIKHVSSGKYIHPQGGEIHSGDNTRLVLHEARHWGALFALDGYNDRIIHISGRYVHPHNFKPNPKNETAVVLHSGDSVDMKFEFVSTKDPKKEILVYGKLTMAGQWKIVHLVLNPKAEHLEKIELTIGKSATGSRKGSFQYKWEMSTDLLLNEVMSTSISSSLQYMMEKSSSATWSEQTTKSREIRVKPGETVVTWQYVFDVEQGDSRSVFKSNLLADTNSESKEPEDLQYALK
ncbi:galactose-binding lectin-like [Mercenaria mercenaria]|uniref:galactose-binding lectin-like n=1 Tax=Mercenaria mercenaria TaxID=6596 RepID=UPI00234F83DB|nr:galactose-binding lectin-like [Mercenaria mercenaria]